MPSHDGHEFEQALGGGDGQRSLLCCSPWGLKESDTTERLHCTALKEYSGVQITCLPLCLCACSVVSDSLRPSGL